MSSREGFEQQQKAAQADGFVIEELSGDEDEPETAGPEQAAGRAKAGDTSGSRAAGARKGGQKTAATSAPTSGEAGPKAKAAESAGKAASQTAAKDSEFVVETFDPNALNADAPEFIPVSMQSQDTLCEDYYDEINHIVYHAAGGYTFFDFDYGQWVYVSPESMALSEQQREHQDDEDDLHMDEIDSALDEVLWQREQELVRQEQELDEEDEQVRQFEAALEKDGLL